MSASAAADACEVDSAVVPADFGAALVGVVVAAAADCDAEVVDVVAAAAAGADDVAGDWTGAVVEAGAAGEADVADEPDAEVLAGVDVAAVVDVAAADCEAEVAAELPAEDGADEAADEEGPAEDCAEELGAPEVGAGLDDELAPDASVPLVASPDVVGAVGTDVVVSPVVALSVSGAGAGTNSVADGGTV